MDIRSYYLSPKAVDLPDQAPPKVPSGKSRTVPSYLGNTRKSTISNSATNITNLDLTTFRTEASMWQVIKKLVLTSPDLSHAVETKIKSSMSKRYTVIAYDKTGRVDAGGTELIQSFVQRLNLGAYDYTKFTRSTDLRSLTSSLLYDSFRYGSMCSELVLGDMRMPAYIKHVPSRLLDWADNTPEVYPIYTGGDEDIHLNFPTIIYSSTIQDGESAYSESPLQTAIQASLWDAEFANDLRRAATKNLLQRLKVTIDSEKYKNTLPLSVTEDPEKLSEHLSATISNLETTLASLGPDDSLVITDVLDADTISDANRSEDRSIDVLSALINGRISSGAKILPAIIGRGASSNAASTESMLFLKTVASAQLELNNLISRTLTLAIRLFGFDNYVRFELEEVNLRPELELESFKTLRDARIYRNCSFGFITDEEASIMLTGKLPPKGFVQLSGTRFAVDSPSTTNNDYSNTSAADNGKPDSTQAQKDSEI